MPTLRAVLVACLTPLALGAQQPTPQGTHRADPVSIRHIVDSLANAFIARHEAPGVSIVVIRGRDTLVSQGYGLSDVENGVQATPHTVYRIGSITKQFTSAAVMQLVEAGRVKLDDSIGAYLPTLPARWRAATVRQYLNHTSGVPSYTDIGPRWLKRIGEKMSPDTLVGLTATDSLWFAPGKSWRYDNTGYVVLGMLIEKVSGKAYDQYLKERFFTPLGLSETMYCYNAPIIPHRAQGYGRDSSGWRNASFIDMSQPFSAGALCSSALDLSHWNESLGTGKVVSLTSYRAMTTPTGAAMPRHYGFGLVSDTLAGHRIITHSGGIPGFSTINAWFPDDSLSITVLPNSESARPDRLMNSVARVALGMPLEQPPQPVTLSATDLGRYAGQYSLQLPNGSALPMRIWVEGSRLMSQATGQGPIALIPYGHDVFGADFDSSVRLTFTVVGEHATKFTLLQGG
ncbi:MAG TPA: serine hydrolase domain-containing protein, partial [Gemmatimonadaceae bacterium]|nr:serine hydrolase domain-containing protein [Gemmatimonadaceae bacterium]